MTVDFVYRIYQYIINKHQSNYLAPDEFNLVNNQSQISWGNYLLGQYNQYQYGNSKPRIQYSESIQARQSLTPIIYGYNLHIDSTGFAPYPADYQQRDTMMKIYGDERIRYTEPERWFSTRNSVIDVVSNANPIFTIEQNGFRFAPANLLYGQAKLTYVQTPPPMLWAYTLDGNGEPIYDPINSIDPIWSDFDMLELISRGLKMIGISLQAPMVSQYANEVKLQGQ